jgi:hypothetical protein
MSYIWDWGHKQKEKQNVYLELIVISVEGNYRMEVV